ncbi:hypothetical protein A3C37_03715 [Candidatus Peribacteria bacterium RIFCSPHIGHO2_02_FULL_53_20]|nr:MAG: hypothetical protein A3C37_03715 [Candidatus Peribacteria bacterium RIFCSPHIGHO2_02_FULL_53_20]OGJ67153.1 MAG: hypothetical protein A3B61_02905 [Candidatus Peribacteria bacterium RIFCSPLOWO2_01_FULL_53_10]OGJ75058.1 MAG: hypothetical protein A3G69_05465 [Candidatus Peribacteria bacterium RIFCSPLOWO2_12_FULL_53_10]
MTSKIVKSTPRGQITLPKQWRSHFSTNNFIVEMHQDRLVIHPFDLAQATAEEIIFDADRDNHGKGIPAREMIRLIKKINHEQN